MEHNINSTDGGTVKRNRDFPRPELLRPNRDYVPASVTVAEKPPMPEELRGLFEGRGKRYGLRLALVIIAAVVMLAAFTTGVFLGIEERNKEIEDAVPEGMEAMLENASVQIYEVPESQIVKLQVQDIPREQEELTVSEIYEKCIDSVVDITAIGSSTTTRGVGLVMTETGLILTNEHIIDTGVLLFVTLHNDRVYEARLVGSDPEMDVAVLKIEAPNLVPVQFGDSDQLKVGDNVVAIGSPTTNEELRGTLTVGYVSALNRKMDLDVTLIQTDAAINSGNSGGALINGYGQVVGVTVMKMTSSTKTLEGLGFAIPISSVKTVVEEIIKEGEYLEPNIGIMAFTVTAEMSAYYKVPKGVMVDSITEAAQEQGCQLMVGDIIMELNGVDVDNMNQLNDVKYRYTVGDTLTAKVYRGSRSVEVEVPLLRDNQLE